MRRVLLAALLLLITSLVLGATVFRASLANAASNVPSFFVANDSANPVPVRVQGPVAVTPGADRVTEYLGMTDVSPGTALNLDVSRFQQVRIAIGGYFCGGTDSLSLIATEGPDAGGRLDTWQWCADQESRTYEVPGRNLRINCFCDAGHHAQIHVWGRTG